MAAVIAFTPNRAERTGGEPVRASRRLSDEEVVRLARTILADRRAWAPLAADLDPLALRAAQARAMALLSEALETI